MPTWQWLDSNVFSMWLAQVAAMAAPSTDEQLKASPYTQAIANPQFRGHLHMFTRNTWQVCLRKQMYRAALTALPMSPGAGGMPTLMKRKAGSQCPRNLDRVEILLQLAVHILRGRSPRSKNSLQLRKEAQLQVAAAVKPGTHAGAGPKNPPLQGGHTGFAGATPGLQAATWSLRLGFHMSRSQEGPHLVDFYHMQGPWCLQDVLQQVTQSLTTQSCCLHALCVSTSKRSFCQLLSSAQSTWKAMVF